MDTTNRRKYCTTLLIGILALGWAVNAVAQERPNVIVFLSDDQGWGDFSCNGNTNLATPNIDSLARDGIVMDNFYVCPVCSPTRAEFLTGRYHPRSNVFGVSTGQERLSLDESTVADTLKNAGYATAAFGKWHNGMQYPYHPLARGFDEFYGFCSGHWGNYFSPMLEHNGELIQGKGFIIDDLTNRALDFIESKQDQPFFLYLPYNTPHWPPQVPDKYWDKFADKELPMRFQKPNRENLTKTRCALAMVENIDWNVGRVLKKLDELNLSDNTIVMYFNDNGPNSPRWNANLKGRKGSVDEGGVRSPLFVRWPQVIRDTGRRLEQVSGAIDLLPTLCAATGASRVGDKTLDGENLLPLWKNEIASLDFRMIFSHWRDKVSVRTQKFRLDDKGQLFDMDEDPGQTKNIATDFPEVAAILLTSVIRFKMDTLSLIDKTRRPFPLGHPDFALTQLPARDAEATGDIQRSSKHPNCSYFSNWTKTEDFIHWPIEVLEDGNFEVELYYTCRPDDIGAELLLQMGDAKLTTTITQAHDPPVVGPELDKFPRSEAPTKNFQPVKMGTIELQKGTGQLQLRTTQMPGKSSIDFRLLMFRRVE